METKDLKTLYMANLKAAKEKLGKSVSKMALDMNMSSSTINSYLQGERTVSLEFVTRLYENYGINANWFCTGEGNMFNSAPENFAQQTKQDKKELAEMVKKVLMETLIEYGGNDAVKKLLK